MIRQAFRPYIDSTLSRRVAEAKAKWDIIAQEAIEQQIDAEHLARIRDQASTKLEELREEIEQINSQLDLVAGEHFTLPPIEVPEPEVELDPERQALVSFDDDWVSASQALIKQKSYGKDCKRRPTVVAPMRRRDFFNRGTKTMFLPAPKKMPKPATPEPKRVPPSDGLVFRTKWSDGIETRMSVYTFINDLDVKRAIAVSAAAYSSRKRVPMAAITATIEQEPL